MGPSPRGGAYTYDWIENLLGLDMHSVDRILPEFQHPALGDTIGFGKNRMRLERVEPEHVLAWRSEDGNWVWTFVLREQDQQTRLISRNRFRLPTLVARVGMLPMEPASLLMERKMLRGIKKRAEDLSRRCAKPSKPGDVPRGEQGGELDTSGRQRISGHARLLHRRPSGSPRRVESTQLRSSCGTSRHVVRLGTARRPCVVMARRLRHEDAPRPVRLRPT